jgi:hypothetical protein
MTGKIVTKGATEGDLESRIAQALRHQLSWIEPRAVKHQLTFSFQLGHQSVEVDGRTSSRRQGRLDILLEHRGHRLAILELKRNGKAITAADREQGLSYARVLHPRPPLVVVSNGVDTKVYATHDGREIGDLPDEASVTALFQQAASLAGVDLNNAIGTLMGPGSDVWMTAVRAASDSTIRDMTGGWDDPHPIFTEGFHFPRNASDAAVEALRGTGRVVAIEGAPLVGKTHVLRDLVERTRTADDLAVLMVEASGTAADGIAEAVATLLSTVLGWRITADEARHWLESLGQSDGPALVVAVDGLGLEHDRLRHELEALSAKSTGDKLKIVVEADTSVVDLLWHGESGRKATPFLRRGQRIIVEELDDGELATAFEVLGDMHIQYMEGASRADEYRQPWLLRTMASNVVGSPEMEAGMTALMPPLLSLDLFGYTRDRFDQPELLGQASTLASALLAGYRKVERDAELMLRSLHHFMVNRSALRDEIDSADIEAMQRSGLIGTILDSSNRQVIVGRVPELIASEISRQLADELTGALDGNVDVDDAAVSLLAVCAKLPFGDQIGAQAIIDAAKALGSIPMNFIMYLLEQRPELTSLKAGSRAFAWIPELGKVDLRTGTDGSTVVWVRSEGRGFKLPADEISRGYGNLTSWLILSHIAGVPMEALSKDEGLRGRLDPALLGIIGTSPVPLRWTVENIERTGIHTHDLPDGSSLPCPSDAFVEPISFSLYRFLERAHERADEWIDHVCAEGSVYLLNRINLVLHYIAQRNPSETPARWASRTQHLKVRPAFDRALDTVMARAKVEAAVKKSREDSEPA